jgi:hypothetical protein
MGLGLAGLVVMLLVPALSCKQASPPAPPAATIDAGAVEETLVLHDEVSDVRLLRRPDGTCVLRTASDPSVQGFSFTRCPNGLVPDPGEHIERACGKCTLERPSTCPPGVACMVAAPAPVPCPDFGDDLFGTQWNGLPDGRVYADAVRHVLICRSASGTCFLSQAPGQTRQVACPANVNSGMPTLRDAGGCYVMRPGGHQGGHPLPYERAAVPCPDLSALPGLGDAAP